MGKYFVKGLEALKKRFSFIREIRGKGLIIGVELEIEGSKIADGCMEAGLLMNCTAYKVLRFVPPLTIKKTKSTAVWQSWRKFSPANRPVP